MLQPYVESSVLLVGYEFKGLYKKKKKKKPCLWCVAYCVMTHVYTTH